MYKDSKIVTQREEYIYGIHSVTAFLSNKWNNISEILVQYGTDRNIRISEIIDIARSKNLRIRFVDRKYFNKILPDIVHQGIAIHREFSSSSNKRIGTDVFSDERILNREARCTIVLFENINDPRNLGACIRTSEAMGVNMVLYTEHNSADANTGTIHKTSSGATEYIDCIQISNVCDTICRLKEYGFWIYGASIGEDTKSLYSVEFDERSVLIFGNECDGIRRSTANHCDFLVSIDMYGRTESLNVSVATGIFLFRLNQT